MTEELKERPHESSGTQFNNIIAVFIALVTTFITIVSFVQGDAANRDDQANRDSKRYSLEAMERKVSGDALVNFAYNVAYQAFYEYELLTQSAQEDGDQEAVKIYTDLGNRMIALSPMLQPPYFDRKTGNDPDVARYEADVFLVDTTRLTEEFAEATKVKEAWDYKANTYIIHITLLAVALFLFGMATTISGPLTRWIFTIAGGAVTLVAVVWALMTFFKPVTDLRQCKTPDETYAIDAYAQGVGLAYQALYKEAIPFFDKALACDPGYVNARVARASSFVNLGDYPAAAADYESARSAGDISANTAGELAETYYLSGRLDDAVRVNQEAIKVSPQEYWIQFNLALSLLANGRPEEARAEYQKGADLAAKIVSDAEANKAEPPAYLWYGLEDAATALDDLLFIIEQKGENPLYQSLVNPDEIASQAESLVTLLKSYAVALEYTGKPPIEDIQAVISPLTFAEILRDENDEILDYRETEVFPSGTFEVAVLFDFEEMKDGRDLLMKVSVNGVEDPAWRLNYAWNRGPSGSAKEQLSLADSMTQVLKPGEYTVEIYVDSHLTQRGFFKIAE